MVNTAFNLEKKHLGDVVDTIDGNEIIECSTCGFRHVNPLPCEEELRATYRHDYYLREKPLSIERHKEDKDWHNLQYSDRYDIFEQYLAKDRGSILDIGCGPGFFLHHGITRGWQVHGFEPSRQAASHARDLGAEVTEDFLNWESAESLKSFDAIHASLVFEHLPDPADMLAIIHNKLKPNGVICITAPNDYNPFQKILRSNANFDPWWLVPKHHLNYFTPDSLSRLIEKNGFRVIQRENTFPIDMFLLMGDNYIGNDGLGRECHKKRIKFEKLLEKSGRNMLKRQLYRAFTDLDLGREICIYAQRI